MIYSKLKRKPIRKSFLFLLLLILNLIPFSVSGQTSNPNLGLSGYISSQAELENTITVMQSNGLIPYRVSFRPSWQVPEGEYKGYNSAYIDYLVANTDFFIIVDGNHLYPPTDASALDAKDHWTEVQQRTFQTLERYPNNSRVAVELINEYVMEDFDSLIQEQIDKVRAAGYTNPIVINKHTTNWYKFSDPLNNTYQGMHFYFDTWNPTNAINQMDIALKKGITKLLNTEIGASSQEYQAFNRRNVAELVTFLDQCQTLGIGNCIWMNIDTSNLRGYSRYDFPISDPNPTPTPTPKPTPTPTPTPRVTPTPTPTSTPTSTPTPTPTPHKLINLEITLLSPLNQTYHESNIPLTFLVNKQNISVNYNLDNQNNATITANTTITNLSSGAHNLTLTAKDDLENTEDPITIHFYVKEKETESNSTITQSNLNITIAAIPIIAITCVAGILIYIKKYKR